MQVRIYGLIDPQTMFCRYVGKTKGPIARRLRGHLNDAKRHPGIPRFRWINKLDELGLVPDVIELESVEVREWQEAEQFWIAYMRSLGSPLLNATLGGDGLHGHSHTDTAKARMRAGALRAAASNPDLHKIRGLAVSRAYKNPETRKRLSESLKISHARPETRAKLCAAAKANASTPEARARTSAVHLGKKLSDETKKKISLSRLGKKLRPEVVQRIADGHRGVKKSEECKAKMRATWARKKLERLASAA